MDHHDDDLPQRSGTFRAVVRSGESVTTYLRIGNGRPVLLLRGPDVPPILAALRDAIGGAFRLISPEDPPPPIGIGTWFGDFLDGLGLPEVAVVADGDYGTALETSPDIDGDRITRLVVITSAAVSAPAPLHGHRFPVLRVPAERPVDAALGAIIAFLAGAGAGT